MDEITEKEEEKFIWRGISVRVEYKQQHQNKDEHKSQLPKTKASSDFFFFPANDDDEIMR